MKITHIDTKRIGIGNYAFGSAFGDKNRMLVAFSNGVLCTDDGGDNWRVIPKSEKYNPLLYGRLNDGSYVGFDFTNIAGHRFDPAVQEKIPFVLGIYRAKNYDEVLAGTPQRSFAVVDIPDLAVGYGDSGDHDSWGCGAMASGIIQTENGDVIVSMYGQFKKDKSKLPYFTNYDFYQYRTWVLVSHDNCETFEYLSTVADCMTYPVPDAEGYCESDLLYLGNGNILCVMRTQGHEVYTPMMRSISHDYGKTWSAPEAINPYGVLPRLLKMQNGTVVVCSGKWDIFLQTSEDDGETWSKPFVISENDGQWDRGPSGYNSIFETDPNTLVVVYDITEDKVSEDIKEGERRIVYVSRYKIEK
jgi:hypothetical protein